MHKQRVNLNRCLQIDLQTGIPQPMELTGVIRAHRIKATDMHVSQKQFNQTFIQFQWAIEMKMKTHKQTQACKTSLDAC